MIICFPHPPGAGGPGSFQIRFENKLKSLGWQVAYKGSKQKPYLIFVVGGTRQLFWLLYMKIKGVPVLYRLDGINWLHRKKKVGLKNYLLTEYRNWSNKFIHAAIADRIVYQSNFVNDWWNKKGWRTRKNTTVIYNGLEIPGMLLNGHSNGFTGKLVILEGNIDYTPYAVQLLNDLANKLPFEIKIDVYGKFEYKDSESKLGERINIRGFLPREKVNNVLIGAVYLSLDINPACPNTVIEALACGAPVVAFNTGSLTELVPPDAGIIVPYGSDPWKLGYPDVDALVEAILKVKENYTYYSVNARKTAEQRYSIEDMTENYIGVINNLINK